MQFKPTEDCAFTEIIAEDSKDSSQLEYVKQMLKVEKPGWQYDYLVKIGRASKYEVFYMETSRGIVVPTGILEIPAVREFLSLSEINDEINEEISKELDEIIKDIQLPFEPYDYQILAAKKALSKGTKLSLMCTGSGKSLTISLILEYFRRKGLSGCLVVPNINLLTQFANDILSYNLKELHSKIITFGAGSSKLKQMNTSALDFNPEDLIITTWQSLSNLNREFFSKIQYIICDEVHKFSSECTSNLVQQTNNTQFKLGFTGTLPDSKVGKMTLIGLFGVPENIITSKELIDRGLGTPISITAVKTKLPPVVDVEVSKRTEFLDKLKEVISYQPRTKLIVDIAMKASMQSSGSTLILFTLTEHGEQIYQELTGLKEIPTLQEMQKLGIYFMSGQSKAKDREAIRTLMQDDPSAILVANYALLSTGVNIKSLRYAIFASPLKSGVSIAQSLGRGIRLHIGKDEFKVYDIVDVLPNCKIFTRQYTARKKIYEKNNFKVQERKLELS